MSITYQRINSDGAAVTIRIGPEDNCLRELSIWFLGYPDEPRWTSFFRSLFAKSEIKFHKFSLSAYFPSNVLRSFLSSLDLVDEFVREHVLHRLQFNVDQTTSDILSQSFEGRTVPQIWFAHTCPRSKTFNYSPWLQIAANFKPRYIEYDHTLTPVLNKGCVDFLLQLANTTEEIGIERSRNDQTLSFATELFIRKCRIFRTSSKDMTLSDIEKLIQILHHCDKNAAFKALTFEEEISAQIGSYKVHTTDSLLDDENEVERRITSGQQLLCKTVGILGGVRLTSHCQGQLVRAFIRLSASVMSIHFRSTLTCGRITLRIEPERYNLRKLTIQFGCELFESRWMPYFEALFGGRGIKAASRIQSELTAMLPPEELEPFLKALMMFDYFERETELDSIEFDRADMESLQLISELFVGKTVSSTSFDHLKSFQHFIRQPRKTENMHDYQQWLDVVAKLKPQKVIIREIELNKGSIEFLLKLSNLAEDVAVMDVTVEPESDIICLPESSNGYEDPEYEEMCYGIIRMLAREMLSAQCRTLFVGVQIRKSDAEKLIEIFHHFDKPVSFGTWKGPASYGHVDKQIGNYKVNVLRIHRESMLSIVHTDLANPFII